jgi:hypothetical protein
MVAYVSVGAMPKNPDMASIVVPTVEKGNATPEKQIWI